MIKEKLKRIAPEYSWGLLTAVVILNCITYFGTRLFTSGMKHHSIQLAVDRMIPFCPHWIVVYFLAFPFWVCGFILIARESREMCRIYLIGEMIAKTICLICFVVFPTTLVRPIIDADGSFWEQLVALLYRIDSPDNLFPSIHCLESWICFRSARKMKKAPPRYRNVAAVATIMIFASTQLLKQHVLLDVAGAIAAGEMGLLLAHKLYVQREGATV